MHVTQQSVEAAVTLQAIFQRLVEAAEITRNAAHSLEEECAMLQHVLFLLFQEDTGMRYLQDTQQLLEV